MTARIGVFLACLLVLLIVFRIGIWFGRRGRENRIGDLVAKLSVVYAQQNAAQQRADRLDRDLREEKRLHRLTKDAAATEKDTLWVNLNSRLEDIDQLKADLVERNETIARLSQDLNVVEELKTAVGRAQATPHLGVEAEQFLANVREGGL